MLEGIHLTVLAGPAVPVPVPYDVLDALTSVEVHTSAEPRSQSGFTLTFSVSNRSIVPTIFLVAGGSLPPILRVVIIVTLNGMPQPLIDGVMTKAEVTPGTDPGQSTLTVTGVDLSALMGLIELNGLPYPAMPPEARIALILAKYAVLGVIPVVIPAIMTDISVPTDKIPRQKGTDLDYINELADENGYVFYLTPGPVPATSFAYWGPQVKVGVPQPALNINMDAQTNVDSLSFRVDTDSRKMPIVYIQNKETKVPIPIPIPDISPLNPPLGLVPTLPKKFNFMDDTAKLSPVRAILRGLTEASRSADAVTGTGSLDVLRYGRVLQARQLVGVRGAGTAFDGLYFVKGATHTIKRGEYKQSFSLSRNGLVSITPVVPA